MTMLPQTLPGLLPVFGGPTTYRDTPINPDFVADGFSGSASMVAASTGKLYLTYADAGRVVVRVLDGGTWSTLDDGRFSSSGHPSLAVDASGVPYVVFVEGSDSGASVLKFENGNWVAVGQGNFSGGAIEKPLIRFDPAGKPYAVFVQGSDLRVSSFENGAWTGVGAASLAGIGSRDFDLTFTPAGAPVLALVDSGNDSIVRVLNYDGTQWRASDIGGAAFTSALKPQIAVSGTKTYLAFGTANGMVLRQLDGEIWSDLPIPGVVGTKGFPVELSVAADGGVYLAVQTHISGGEMHVLRLENGAWKAVGTPHTVATSSAFAIDRDGNLYTGFVDGTSSTPLSVHKNQPVLGATAVSTGTGITGIAATDADGDTLQYQVVGGTDQALFTVVGNQVQFLAAPAAGTYTVEVRVNDGTGTVTRLVSVTVEQGSTVPTPPVPTTPTAPATPGIPAITNPTGAVVDGVNVQIGTVGDMQVVIVPVVTSGRSDDANTPNSNLADIALVKSADGATLLTVSVPTGSGVSAAGSPAPLSGAAAQAALDSRIGASTNAADLKAAGLQFLSGLGTRDVVIQTLTPTAQGAGGSIKIGANNNVTTGNGPATALVIDTTGLVGPTDIVLDNIDFAVILGNARVTGGAGANLVFGGDGKQFIVLGADDDMLHGGGNDDTVGSLRGKDQTFGDAGNDVVYGGTDDDVLIGGAGNDVMNGGVGMDSAKQSGTLAEYAVSVDGQAVVLSHRVSGEVDRFIDVEHIVFDQGPSLAVAHEAADVATLRAQFADAQIVELKLDRAVTGSAGNDVIAPTLGMALRVDLGGGQDIVKLAGARAGVHIDVETGQRAELTRLADGAMLSFSQVEMLAFDSGEVTVLAHTRGEAVIGRAYEVLLDRNVDTAGYGFWSAQLTVGALLQGLLTAILATPEAAPLASLSNADFVEQLYVRGLARSADAAGKAFWLGGLDAGATRAQIVEGFATTSEAIRVIGSTIDVTIPT